MVQSALTICSGTIRCLEGIGKMANIVNTEETYLKEQSDQCLYSLPPQGKPFYTTYLANLTLPEKNSVKTDQTVPSRVV